MSRPTSKKLAERILQGYDRDHYDGIYAQMNYAFGNKWRTGPSYISTRFGNDEIPVYPDITVRKLEIGQSRRILNASHASLSRVLSRPPLPKFPQVDEVTEEVRRQFWLANANGNRGVPTKWLKQMQYAYVEGDTLGVGAVLHGMRTHPVSGLQIVDMLHVPALQVVWDPFESDPRNSKWVCVIRYLPAEVAEKRFGKSAVADHVRDWTVTSGGKGAKFVRVFLYFDTGYAEDEPIKAVFVGDLKDGKIKANDIGIIPVSFCVNYVAPGMRRPMGRVPMQMSTQEMINELERTMRDTIRKGAALDIYDPSVFDSDSIKRWKKGDKNADLEIDQSQVDDIKKIFMRIPGKEIPQTLLAFWGIQEEQYDSDSNQSDARRGQSAGSRTTAKEISLIQSNVNANSSLTGQMAVEFLQDAVSDSMHVALSDLHPVDLDILGKNILFNDPEDSLSQMHHFLSEPSKVIIDLDAATAQDDAMKKQERVAELSVLEPWVIPQPMLDPAKYQEELLEAIGVKNVQSWIVQPQPDLQTTKSEGSSK